MLGSVLDAAVVLFAFILCTLLSKLGPHLLGEVICLQNSFLKEQQCECLHILCTTKIYPSPIPAPNFVLNKPAYKMQL